LENIEVPINPKNFKKDRIIFIWKNEEEVCENEVNETYSIHGRRQINSCKWMHSNLWYYKYIIEGI
jgi:hypothetical protein